MSVRILCGMMFALALCGPAFAVEPTQQEVAKARADAWLKGVDAGRYPESWDQAAALFKKAVAKEKWIQDLGAVRTPLGKLVSRSLKSSKLTAALPGAPDGSYVVLEYDTRFENKQAAIETLTPMLDPDGQWRVAGYFIR